MLSADLCRGVVNHRINRIKRFFKWAVSEELMPVSVYESLRTVAGLRLGKTEARESDPVRPVPDACVEATLEAASPQIAAMIRVQRLTGMRPCEVVIMRGRDIDRSADVWVYAPSSHKSQWRGLHRHVPLGPKAQAIIEPFLTANLEAHLFSPKDAEMHRNHQRKAARKSPMTPSQSARRPLATRKRPTRDSYDVDSYRRAISYAIKKANAKRPDGSKIPHWFPLQLRHSRATEIRRGFGIEAAQVSLGHAHANVTEVYAERNLSLAIEIARKTG